MNSISPVNEIIPGLKDYGVGNEDQASEKGKLGQEDFLMLMTTQLKNQDPFAPMENGEFIAQMAQFSTVNGIEEVNENLLSIGSGLAEFRVATASSLLGQMALVSGNVARPDNQGEIKAEVNLETPADEVIVSYVDDLTGELLHSQNYGAQPPGKFEFTWHELPASVKEGHRAVKVKVSASDATGSATVTPKIYAKIVGVDLASDNQEMRLIVEDHGALNGSQVTTLR